MKSQEELIIRKATKEDIQAMMDLIKELAEFEREPNAVAVSLREFEEAGFGTNPIWEALVALVYDEGLKAYVICATALYYIRYSTWKGKMMYLEDIIVSQHYRGKGIGTLLISRLSDEAKQKKLSGMCWQVLEWNTPAISFYKKMEGVSFDKDYINVKKML